MLSFTVFSLFPSLGAECRAVARVCEQWQRARPGSRPGGGGHPSDALVRGGQGRGAGTQVPGALGWGGEILLDFFFFFLVKLTL